MANIDSRLQGTRFEKLTARELELLRGFPASRRAADLAVRLEVSKETIRTHLRNVRRKLEGRDLRLAAQELASLESDELPLSTPVWVMDQTPLIADAALWQPAGWADRLPFRTRGARGNELSYRERLIWIGVIAIGIAVGFGTAAAGMRFVSDIIGAIAAARQH